MTGLIQEGPFVLAIDRGFTLEQLITAGKYGTGPWAIEQVSEKRFPVDRSGELVYAKEVFLEPLPRNGITTVDWHAELHKNEWQLEQAVELLTFGIKYPDFRQSYNIVAFGSTCEERPGYQCSPALWRDRGKFESGTICYAPDGLWHGQYALVSRKQK